MKIPFQPVSLDQTGKSGGTAQAEQGADVQWNREALLYEAMRATSAYPVVFQPKPMGNQYLVDGGISDNLPVNLLMASGVPQVLAIDLSSPYQPPKKRDLIEIASHSLTIMPVSYTHLKPKQ